MFLYLLLTHFILVLSVYHHFILHVSQFLLNLFIQSWAGFIEVVILTDIGIFTPDSVYSEQVFWASQPICYKI